MTWYDDIDEGGDGKGEIAMYKWKEKKSREWSERRARVRAWVRERDEANKWFFFVVVENL